MKLQRPLGDCSCCPTPTIAVTRVQIDHKLYPMCLECGAFWRRERARQQSKAFYQRNYASLHWKELVRPTKRKVHLVEINRVNVLGVTVAVSTHGSRESRRHRLTAQAKSKLG